MLEEIEPELDKALTFFVKKRNRLAWGYGMDSIHIAPHDTFSEEKSDEIKFIVYGLKDDKIYIIKGTPFK